MTSAIILAGGKSDRFGSSIPKWKMSLNGKKVIQYCIDIIEPLVDEVIVVCNEQYGNYKCVNGGKTRNESVLNGVKASKYKNIIVHDGARPFIKSRDIENIKNLMKKGAVCVDTVSEIVDGFIDGTIPTNKKGKLLGLTPEGFVKDYLLRAYEETDRRDWQDEVTMLYEVLGIKPYCNIVHTLNSKITYQQDLAYAEGIMRFWNEPIQTKPDFTKPTLVFGGSGDIGKACVKMLRKCYAPTRKEIDLSEDWSFDLSGYESIIYSAGEYKDDSKIMKVNFESAVKLIQLAEDQEWEGNIVFLSSTAATYGRRVIPVYSASKSALNAYIEARHEELAKKGIFINAIAPAKVWGQLQRTINPKCKKEDMIATDYIADYILRYIDTDVSGHIIYLRKGFDV